MNKTEKLLQDITNNSLIKYGIAYIETEEYYDHFKTLYPDKPKGNYKYMVEYYSECVNPDDDDLYQGYFSSEDLSGNYIRDAMEVINRTINIVQELREQYRNQVDIQFVDFNKGCQYGCAIRIWIP